MEQIAAVLHVKIV